MDHALKRLQKMLNDLSEWGKTCGLKFNPEKSVAVVFSRRRKEPPFSLSIDGKDIAYQTEVKYLGVTLDSKLHWTKHIEEKLTKTKKYLGKIARLPCLSSRERGERKTIALSYLSPSHVLYLVH